VREIQRGFPNARVGNGFGLTETSAISTFLPHECPTPRGTRSGSRRPRWTSDLDRTIGHADERVGELLIRGGNVVAGY
jgi:long-subunit acyl-CoA synthetase (AMP-forming)